MLTLYRTEYEVECKLRSVKDFEERYDDLLYGRTLILAWWGYEETTETIC
jgi:hypothetical protein